MSDVAAKLLSGQHQGFRRGTSSLSGRRIWNRMNAKQLVTKTGFARSAESEKNSPESESLPRSVSLRSPS